MSLPSDIDPPLSPAEEHFLDRQLRRLRDLESRTRGEYAESLLCTVLPGAEASEYAAEAFDLRWRPSKGRTITIAVRTSGSRNSDHDESTKEQAGGWAFPPVLNWSTGGDERRRCWADVAVLCFHDGWDLAEGWHFYVLSASEIEGFPAKRLTTPNLARQGHAAVSEDKLPAAIKAAARRG